MLTPLASGHPSITRMQACTLPQFPPLLYTFITPYSSPSPSPSVPVQRSTFICCLRSLARSSRTFRGPLSHSFAHRIVSIAHRPSPIVHLISSFYLSIHRHRHPPTVPLSTCTLTLALASNHCRYRRLASARPRPRPRPGHRPRCIPPLPLPTLLPGHNPTGPYEIKLEPTIVDARLAAGDLDHDHDHDQE